MAKMERMVIGTFEERDDAIREIQRLHTAGYTAGEINVYANRERAQTVERMLGVEVEGVDVDEIDEDMSWWDSIKNAFSFFVYDADQGSHRIHPLDAADRSDLSPEMQDAMTHRHDVLEPYADDLAAGKLVIVVENYTE